MKILNYHLYLTDDEYSQVIHSLIELKNKATLVGNIYDVLVGYIGQGISKEVIDRMSEEYIKTFSLGDYI